MAKKNNHLTKEIGSPSGVETKRASKIEILLSDFGKRGKYQIESNKAVQSSEVMGMFNRLLYNKTSQ